MLTSSSFGGGSLFSSSGSGSRVDTTATRNRCLAYISESRKFLSSNLLTKAYQSLNNACGSAIDADLRSQITDLAKSLEDSGGKLLTQADQNFAAGKYTEAMRLYRSVCTMAKLKVGASARAKISKAEKDPAFASVVRNARAAEIYSAIHVILHCAEDPEEKAAAAAAAATKDDTLADGGTGAGSDDADIDAHAKRALKAPIADQVRLMATLDQVIKTYAGTPSAKCAEQLRDKLTADSTFATAVEKQKKDDTLKNDFAWAQQQEKAGMPAKAIEAYKQVIADGPGTDWATKAKVKIDSIEQEEKLKALMR